MHCACATFWQHRNSTEVNGAERKFVVCKWGSDHPACRLNFQFVFPELDVMFIWLVFLTFSLPSVSKKHIQI